MRVKNKRQVKSRKFLTGFTLIELLVVIAVIGLLATVVTVSVNSARKKARDVKKISDLKQIQTALQLFYDKNQRMPNNYNPCCGACEDTYYNQSMQEIVNDGFLTSIPRSPGNGSYCYYNYGAGNQIGAILVTTLENYSGTTGLAGSCRPWAPNANWCSQSNNNYHCFCTPY
ncbi:MAG: prepilin-type N-terminal cleavage/methylation domain-containing protein [Candidatus Doudnabacteria bacterium]